MNFFEEFTSNTYAGSSNQLFFCMADGESRKGRVFYKISTGGKYNYSFLFSNIIDSTYSDGSISHKNLICDSWVILEGRVGKSAAFQFDESVCPEVTWLSGLTFHHSKTKEVMPGEFFSSDPVKTVLSKKVLMVFDNVQILSVSDEKAYMAKFGGHPNAEGCNVWATALCESLVTHNIT